MYKIKKMSEDVHTTLHGVLGLLEGLQNSPDDALYTNKPHIHLLKSINSLLGSGDEITSDDAEKVLKVCLQNALDMRSAPYTLSIISTLLSIEKEKPFVPSVDFLPSALAVLELLKKTAEEKKPCIRTLAFQVFMAHTTPTLVNVVMNYSAVLFETFSLFYTLHKGHADNKIETFIILQLLKVLPDHEKSIFIKAGIPMWFENILPCLVQVVVLVDDRDKIETCMSYTEALTDQLVLYDYFDYPEWQNFLINIADRKKYPLCIKSLLDKGKDTWHRLWIMFVKLIKCQVTKAFGTYGTPINSLLPVVESAFKLENIQRVRAFACWNELITIFLNDPDANCLGKRIRLVLIPLKLNNAKTYDTAAAKFNTWWLLIQRFKPKLENHTKEVLIPFLNFLFGKWQHSKQTFWAGQLSNTDLRQKCLEAFVEIVGHSDCEGCTTEIEPLNEKIIDTGMLADYWKDWLFSLKAAISIAAKINSIAARKRLRCLWKSYILLMAELLDNSVRRDWLNDIINALSELAEESNSNNDLVDIIIEDLMLPLYRDPKLHTLLGSRSLDHRPMHKIVVINTGKTFDSFFKRYDPDELQRLLEPLVSGLVIEAVANPAYMVMLLDELQLADGSFKLWTALARKATEFNLCLQVYNALLRWPLKAVLAANDIKDAALAWYTLYNTVHVKLEKIGFDNEISKLLTKPVEDNEAANYLVLFALIGVLKYKPDEDKLAKLEALTYEMNVYEDFEPLIPALVDALALLMDNSSTEMHESLVQITINCINNVLKLINSKTKSNKQSVSRETPFSEARANHPSIKNTVLTDTIMTAMKNFLAKNKNESLKKEVQNVISSLEKSDDKPAVESPKKTVVSKEFASPKMQEVQKTKKKEPSIVNTVVENGEEYVVVKSNWKFNPKNLTENQKEKFQRKRDIPALYQDLSQSQDEFKLSSWKTDSNSQDTSLSSSKSSKSASNNDVAEVLKNMSSTDVVPKIIENILDNAKNTQPKMDVTSPASIDKVLNVDKVTTPQGTKSPRIALKDLKTDVTSPATVDKVLKVDKVTTPQGTKSPRIVLNDLKTDVTSPATVDKVLKVDKVITPQGTKSPRIVLKDLKTDVTSPATVDKVLKVDKVITPQGTKSPRMALKDRVFRNVRNLIEKSSPLPTEVKNKDQNELDNVCTSPTLKLSNEKTENKNSLNQNEVAKRPDPKLMTEENAAMDKQESESPVAFKPSESTMNNVIIVTRQQNPLNTTLIGTPLSKTKPDTSVTNSVPILSTERPTRMKRKPKKFDDSLLLAFKKSRHSNNESQDSQDLKDVHPEVTVALMHMPKAEKTETDQTPNTVADIDITKKVDNKRTKKSDDVLCDIATKWNALKYEKKVESHTSETNMLVTPTTPITNKATEKSPEKPTTIVEVPTDVDKASGGFENDVRKKMLEENQEELPSVKTPSNKLKVLSQQKSLTKKKQSETKEKTAEVIITPVITTRKAKQQIENILNAASMIAVSTVVDKSNDLEQETSVRKTTDVEIDTKKEDKKAEMVCTPMIKTKSKEVQQKSSKKSAAEKNKDFEQAISVRKTTDVEIETKTEDTKTEVISTPVIKTKSKEVQQKSTLKSVAEKSKDLEQETSVSNTTDVEIETKTEDTKTEVISTPVIKTKSKEVPQKSMIKSVAEKSKNLEQETLVSNTTDVEIETKTVDSKTEIISTPVIQTKSKEVQQKSTKKSYTEKENTIFNAKLESVTQTDKSKDVKTPIPVKRKNATTETKNELVTPIIKPKDSDSKLSVKKAKKIEKELMIDMVEGHPFLKSQSEKRLTRKKIMEAENSSRRKSLAEKLNKSKLEATPKSGKKLKEKKTSLTNPVTVEKSQDRQNSSEEVAMDEPPCSEDIIESSQDSTMTTISVKSTKRTPMRQPIVAVEKLNLETTEPQKLIHDSEMNVPNDETHEKTDIELPQNKTVEVDKNLTDLTENMETEPMDDNDDSDKVVNLDETEPLPITINSEPIIGPETQELAEADTQPNGPNYFMGIEKFSVIGKHQPPFAILPSDDIQELVTEVEIVDEDITQSLSEATRINIDETNDVSSPYKDDNVRKQDFLNNTLEISPIKIQSPDREKKSPSPETSSDFVVIKLSSPVHSNGEPFDKHSSPEFFTEDKISPDKRDSSPPRVEVTVTNTSPSSSLSLKKNRPQVRPVGRAAQMLDLLCVTSDLKVTKVPERVEIEETKKTSVSTPVRRNLRILYSSVGDSDMPEQNVEETNNFLKLKRSLPTVSSSPSGPILKRKLIDITDEATTSPATKRKRVSFHDPPVSITVSVHKYIEPLSLVRSPQSSKKRQNRQGIKSPKRLENAFNLDSVLSKTVESFADIATPTDTQNTSLDVTPIVEIVKTSELNDTDPFYPELISCKEPIQVIATELSSPAMRELFIKELEGKVDTIGDLAKMTELEINRLCIKAPKIQVAKKVLRDYFNKRPANDLVETVIGEAFSELMTESLLNKTVSVEMQTDAVEISSTTMPADITAVVASTQTDSIVTAHTSMQTDESDSNSDDISTFLTKKEEFVEKLTEKLDEESMRTIAEKLPLKSLFDLIITKSEDTTAVFNSILKQHSKDLPNEKKSYAELSFVRDILCERYESRDLLLLCSQMLQKIYDKADKQTLK